MYVNSWLTRRACLTPNNKSASIDTTDAETGRSPDREWNHQANRTADFLRQRSDTWSVATGWRCSP